MKKLICFALLTAVLMGCLIPAIHADGMDTIDALKPVLRLDETGHNLNADGSYWKWVDKSGNSGNLFANAPKMTAPTYKENGLNGKPTLVFSHTGVGLRLTSEALVQGKQYTAFAVYKTDMTTQGTDTKEQFVFRLGGTTQLGIHMGLQKNGSYAYAASTMAKNGAGWGALQTGKQTDTAFHISAVTYDAEAGTFATWVDGKSAAASGDIYKYTGATSGNWFFIGTDSSKSKGLEGEIAAIVMFDRVLTGEQIDMAANQLAGNYALSWENLTDYTAPGTETAANRLLGVQESAVADGKYSVRFVASLDSLDYRAVGFRITAKFDGKSVNYAVPCENVYDEILASDVTGVTKKVTAKDLGVPYLAAVTVTGIPKAKEIVFRVQPYYINAEGTEVPASAVDITYSGGAFISAAAAK